MVFAYKIGCLAAFPVFKTKNSFTLFTVAKTPPLLPLFYHLPEYSLFFELRLHNTMALRLPPLSLQRLSK